MAQPGRGATNVAYASEDAETAAGDGTDDLGAEGEPGLHEAMRAVLAALNPTGPDPVWPTKSSEFARYLVEQVETAFLAAGWRPPLPKADLRTWRPLLAGIIDGHFGDDYREQAESAAEEIIGRGWLDKVADVGPPEPVATTLRRIITDLESEAMAYCPVGIFGVDVDPVEISQTNRVQAETLREYADRLRGHPALKGESAPLPGNETEKTVVADFCAERAQYVTALKQNTDGGADYHRWQGHAEARRQLSERLGLPVAPAEVTS